MALVLFLLLEVMSIAFSVLLGALPVAAANLVASAGMAVFFAWSRWQTPAYKAAPNEDRLSMHDLASGT
jgi:hypothetical protein